MQSNPRTLTPPEWMEEYSYWFATARDIPEFAEDVMSSSERYALMWLAKEIDVPFVLLHQVLKGFRNCNPEFEDQVYFTRYKPKRSGGFRKICCPEERLGSIQRALSKYLATWYTPHSRICGFSGGNIEQALLPHTGGTWLLKVDFKDAFPSVHREDVLHAFERLKYRKHVANALADFTTFCDELPQGAPSSPRVFDIVCAPFDHYMRALVQKYGATYTRYADNIFVSVTETEFPQPLKNGILKLIENRRKNGAGSRRPGPSFSWHKLRVCRMSHATVRGLGLNIIDGKLHNTREWKRRFRKHIAHVAYLLDNGLPYDDAFRKLEGMVQFAREDTLPASLTEAFDAIYHRVYQVRRPWAY
jgi:hypothetical protein